MSKVDIISGFLGAGKTTLIKKLIKECFEDEKVVLIENEFGEIGIDGSFLKDAGIQITEMNSGCICCSLVGDFTEALKKVDEQYHPDRIIIEPSGVGKLSDVIEAVKNTHDSNLELNSFVTVIDVKKCKIYHKNFGEFFNNQIEYASTVILSRSQDADEDKIQTALHIIRELNDEANIITTPWNDLSGDTLLNAIEHHDAFMQQAYIDAQHTHCCGHHHHEEDHECGCGHHHHEEEHECGCGHHHHEEDHECGCGHHHHEEEHECGCGHHHHEEDHECGCGHHHADEVFTSLGKETVHVYTIDELAHILDQLAGTTDYGMILRAKGILNTSDKGWVQFDLVPGEYEVRESNAEYTGRICVIGKDLNENKIDVLFGVK